MKKVDGPDRDWGPIAAVLTALRPDVVCLQELDAGKAHPADPVDARQADALGEALGMEIGICDSPSRVHTAIAWRPGITCEHWEELVHPLLHHGQALAVVNAEEWPQPVTVASVHLNPFSALAAAIEAQMLTAHLRRWSRAVVVAGDVNAVPVGDPDPPWAELPPHNIAARAQAAPGPLRPDLGTAHVLAHADLVDVAAHLAEQRTDPALRAPTGAGRIRVDQIHAARVLAPGIAHYERCDHHGLSDHHPVCADLRLTPADKANR